MADDPSAEDALMRLAMTGAATHVLSFDAAIVAAATQEDELAALEALAEIVPGPIYRVAALRYGLAWSEAPEALAAAVAEKLGMAEPPAVDPLPDAAAADPEAARDPSAMLHAVPVPTAEDAAPGTEPAPAPETDAHPAATTAQAPDNTSDDDAQDDDAQNAASEPDAGVSPAPVAAAPDAMEAPERRPAAVADDGADAPAVDASAAEADDRLAAVLNAIEALPQRIGAAEAIARLEAALADAPNAVAAVEALGDRLERIAAPDPTETLNAIVDAVAALPAQLDGGPVAERLDALAEAVAGAAAQTSDALAAISAADVEAPAHPDPTDALARIEAALLGAPDPAAALDALAEKIDALAEVPNAAAAVEALAAKIDGLAPPADPAESLQRIEDAIAGVADPTAAVEALAAKIDAFAPPADPAESLQRIEDAVAGVADPTAAVEALAAKIDGLAPTADPAESLQRIEDAIAGVADPTAAVEALAAKIDAIAPPADPSERLQRIEDAVAALAARSAPEPAPAVDLSPILARLEALEAAQTAGFAKLAERADPELSKARAGLVHTTSALQTMFGRLDATVTQLIEAKTDAPDLGAALAPLADRLDALSARPEDDAAERIEALAQAQAAAAAELTAKLDALADRGDAAAALEPLRAEVAALAAKRAGEAAREREGLVRTTSALQTMFARLDGEITRLTAARDAGAAAPDLGPVEARLEAIAAQLDAAPAPADPGAAAADLAALRSDMAALTPRLEELSAAQQATAEALAHRLAPLEAAAAGPGAAQALLEEVRAIAARPAVNVDFKREREALTRLSSAMQTMLSRMDADVARLNGAIEGGDGIASRLAAIEARLRDDPGGASLDAALAEMRALAERAAGGGDLKREREALTRLAFNLQTIATRLETESARREAAGGLGGGYGSEPTPTVTEALRPMTEAVNEISHRLETIESASGLTADHAASLVDLVRRVREECAELHGLHSRYLEERGPGATDAAEALMDRVTATMAEFLARLERAEAGRAGGAAARPAGLAPRLGRAL